MASFGGEQLNSAIQTVVRDREEKLKLARERQNAERQKKIEELKAQAEAAQKYREQKEEERRRRIEEIRHRDIEKRQQVEERKKAITEAENERRAYILNKNQERENKLESKKKGRALLGFAFGSSTPRLLEPSDFGPVSPSNFWGHRRSTSTTNVADSSISRRSSDRELTDNGYKKRATSASGADYHDEDNVNTSQYIFRSVARRKTDLMPTIPNPRETCYGSRTSLSGTPKTSGSRSGDVTPSGSSRPGSAMSLSTAMSTSGYVHRRSIPPFRKSRPVSIAGTGVSLDEINNLKKDSKIINKELTAANCSTQISPKQISNNMTSSSLSRVSNIQRKSSTKKEFPQTKVEITKSTSETSSVENLKKMPKNLSESNIIKSAKTKLEKNALNIVKTEEVIKLLTANPICTIISEGQKPPETALGLDDFKLADEKSDQGNEKNYVYNTIPIVSQSLKREANNEKENSIVNDLSFEMQILENEMTASINARSKIATEEEAKAALAERRRLAREEAERQAGLERQRIEAELQTEFKRQREELEQQRRFEEDALKLAEEQRKAEEERLRQAIELVSKREEEERLKREGEEKIKSEREEAEKKAKVEAEKQRIEVARRLKREEKEREERRKRVEAIMSRTRRQGPTSTLNSTPDKFQENNSKSDTAAEVYPQQHPTNGEESLIGDSRILEEMTTTTSIAPERTLENAPGPILMGSHILKNSYCVAKLDKPQNSQGVLKEPKTEKEILLVKNFSAMIIDENTKNLQNLQEQRQLQTQIIDIANDRTSNFSSNETLHNSLANGNGRIATISNKNEIDTLQDSSVQATNQLTDLSTESQDINNAVNYNNNSLLSTTLVTADIQENKDISLL